MTTTIYHKSTKKLNIHYDIIEKSKLTVQDLISDDIFVQQLIPEFVSMSKPQSLYLRY